MLSPELDRSARATTFAAPAGTAGTSNAQGVPVVPGNRPVASAAQDAGTGTPPNVNSIEEFARKSAPVADVRIPTVPFAGESVKVGVVAGTTPPTRPPAAGSRPASGAI